MLADNAGALSARLFFVVFVTTRGTLFVRLFFIVCVVFVVFVTTRDASSPNATLVALGDCRSIVGAAASLLHIGVIPKLG